MLLCMMIVPFCLFVAFLQLCDLCQLLSVSLILYLNNSHFNILTLVPSEQVNSYIYILWHMNVLQMLFCFLQRQQIQTIERTNKIYSKTCLLCEIMCNILYTGTFLVCRNGPGGNYHKFATLVGEQTPACSTKESVFFQLLTFKFNLI